MQNFSIATLPLSVEIESLEIVVSHENSWMQNQYTDQHLRLLCPVAIQRMHLLHLQVISGIDHADKNAHPTTNKQEVAEKR